VIDLVLSDLLFELVYIDVDCAVFQVIISRANPLQPTGTFRLAAINLIENLIARIRFLCVFNLLSLFYFEPEEASALSG